LPFSQTEFAFLMTPVAGEIEPGMPTPTVARVPRTVSRSSTSRAIASMLAA
jgi:hypothetical protein